MRNSGFNPGTSLAAHRQQQSPTHEWAWQQQQQQHPNSSTRYEARATLACNARPHDFALHGGLYRTLHTSKLHLPPAPQQAPPHESALLLVFSLLPSRDLLCVMPLVSKALCAAAAAALGSRPFSVTSFQVGSSTAQSLAQWLQRHSTVLVHVQLCGFKSGVSPAWWKSICSAPYSSLQHLCLRSCGSPDVPLHLIASSAPRLRSLRLEHSPVAPAAAALAGLLQLTSLTLRSCQLGLQHLAAVGVLTGLLQLELPGNSFVAEQQQLEGPGAAVHAAADTSVGGVPPPAAPGAAAGTSAGALVLASAAAADGGSSCNNSHDSCAAASSRTADSGVPTHHHQQLVQHEQPEDIEQEQHWQQQSEGEQAGQQLPGSCMTRQLSSWLIGLRQLQALDLSECRLQQGLLDQLLELTALTRLQLRRACLDVADPVATGAACATTRLQRLMLGAEDEEQRRARYSQRVLELGAEAAASCGIVGRLQQLIHLDVSHIANACEQLCAGAKAVSGLRILRSINISYTGCTAQQLQQLMVCCPNLRTLNATGNEDLSSAGGCDI